MARDRQRQRSAWHFVLRFVGLTGLVAAAFGLVVWFVSDEPWGGIVAAVGGVLVLLMLLVEAKDIVHVLRSRRGALGSNVGLQVAFALALLVGVNVFSYANYARWDLTREGVFTLPESVREQLSGLKDETLIVLHVRHVTFGQKGGKMDSYDAAAEKKVMAKVKDLVEQFQELGPAFKVVTLDVQEQGYTDALASLTKDREPLRKAIDRSTENSIFFYADGDVQRLGFNDVYQLDKVASREADDGRGNLVLHYQGPETFARRILNIDEKEPKVAVAVIHEALGMEGAHETFSMPAARQALESRGFQTQDVILKKWTEFAPPSPAVLTKDESKYEVLEEQIAEVQASIDARKEEIAELTKEIAHWQDTPLKELNKEYALVPTPLGAQLATREEIKEAREKLKRNIPAYDLEEEHRQQFLSQFRPRLERQKFFLEQEEEERKALGKDQGSLNVENLAELRRIQDLRAKLDRMLADADLLIVPRMTLFNVTSGEYIPNRVHKLEQAQLDAIKDFLKAGKPVLFCVGPGNEPADARPQMGEGPDQLGAVLEQLGFVLPEQTVLFDVESKSFAQRRAGLIILGSAVEPPPLDFDWQAGAGLGKVVVGDKEGWRHPIHESLRLASRSVGEGDGVALRLRHPRPVYYKPDEADQRKTEVAFLMTSPAGWNEAQPFATEKETPRYDPGKSDGTDVSKAVEAERRGPFPIGVAVETPLPESWFAGDQGQGKKPEDVRVAVIGHGGVFMGQEVTPVQEKLLLDTCNWLLGRDDLLASEDPERTWSYPRVPLSATAVAFWEWGARLGLPLLFVYLGVVVLMVRRMR